MPETQPEVQPAAQRRGKAQRQPLTTQEEIALAHLWIDVSEDAAAGNAQAAEHFWMRVTDRFHQELGRESYRSKDSLTTKYDINRATMKFNGLLHNLRTHRKSGQTE